MVTAAQVAKDTAGKIGSKRGNDFGERKGILQVKDLLVRARWQGGQQFHFLECLCG